MKFSVVMPFFNPGNRLSASTATVTNQTFTDWEQVLVDDGSTDGSSSAADALAKVDPRVRVVHQPNGGVSVARNRGLAEARGDYIVFLDADDALTAEALTFLDDLTERDTSTQVFVFPCLLLRDRTLVREPDSRFARVSEMPMGGAEAFERLFTHPEIPPSCHQPWRFVFKRAYWNDQSFRFRPGVIHEDIDLLPEFIVKAAAVRFVRHPFYTYRIGHSDAVTAAFTVRRALDIAGVMGRWMETMDARGIPGACQTDFAAYLAWNFWGYVLAAVDFAPSSERDEFFRRADELKPLLTAIRRPRLQACIKRFLVETLGVERAVRLLSVLRPHRINREM